jgi:cyclopropane fatty-acyl-phospholipid synthase-like methyltransferase
MEFGAGTGMLATQLLDEYGGTATLVDYSESAERLHRKMHKKKRADVEYLVADVFSTSFKPEYDVVYSDGLIEHFKGGKQDELVRKHATASKRLVVIFAPRPSLFYSTTRALLELTGLWLFGYEKPMTLSELSSLCERNGMRVLASESGLWESGVLCEKKPAHKVQKHR